MYKYFGKRLFDLALAVVIFFLVSPVILCVGVLLILVLKGNPFFIQKRPGKNSKIFSIYKFKTMLDTKDEFENLLPDSERLFGLGKFIRRFSLDEFPQIFNVLIGDMSIVGPRPLLVEYLLYYNPDQLRRHNIKPGITGWAQVNGRNAISWEKKFDFDLWYIDHYSFLIDLKIIVLTFFKIFSARDVSMKGHVTTEPFKVNQ